MYGHNKGRSTRTLQLYPISAKLRKCNTERECDNVKFGQTALLMSGKSFGSCISLLSMPLFWVSFITSQLCSKLSQRNVYTQDPFLFFRICSWFLLCFFGASKLGHQPIWLTWTAYCLLLMLESINETVKFFVFRVIFRIIYAAD